jgi:hypothetical protein
MRWRRPHQPDEVIDVLMAPRRVRAIYDDDTESGDLLVVYAGTEAGMHVWEAMLPDGRVPRHITVGTLPANTMVWLPMRTEGQ